LAFSFNPNPVAQSVKYQRTLALAIFQSPRFGKAPIVWFLSDLSKSESELCVKGIFRIYWCFSYVNSDLKLLSGKLNLCVKIGISQRVMTQVLRGIWWSSPPLKTPDPIRVTAVIIPKWVLFKFLFIKVKLPIFLKKVFQSGSRFHNCINFKTANISPQKKNY
jgi:hypothetical protein